MPVVMSYTEEGMKVERGGGSKFLAVFRRVGDATAVAAAARRDYWNAGDAGDESGEGSDGAGDA